MRNVTMLDEKYSLVIIKVKRSTISMNDNEMIDRARKENFWNFYLSDWVCSDDEWDCFMLQWGTDEMWNQTEPVRTRLAFRCNQSVSDQVSKQDAHDIEAIEQEMSAVAIM